MTPLETVLISAIVALTSGIVALWRVHEAEKKETARLIFALLQRHALMVGQLPPPTQSTIEAPQLPEAQKLAVKALNGEIEQYVKDYLESSPGRRVPKK